MSASHYAWWSNELYWGHKRQKADDLPWLMKDIAIEITDSDARTKLFDLLWQAWKEHIKALPKETP